MRNITSYFRFNSAVLLRWYYYLQLVCIASKRCSELDRTNTNTDALPWSVYNLIVDLMQQVRDGGDEKGRKSAVLKTCSYSLVTCAFLDGSVCVCLRNLENSLISYRWHSRCELLVKIWIRKGRLFGKRGLCNCSIYCTRIKLCEPLFVFDGYGN